MSNLTSVYSQTATQEPQPDNRIEINVYAETSDYNNSKMWRQLEAILAKSIVNSGLKIVTIDKNRTTEEKSPPDNLILLAPGFALSKAEYMKRFGNIDLELYKKQMSPELFLAFIRHIGIINGNPTLDIVELTSSVED